MTVDSYLLVNVFILTVCVWLAMFINSNFLRPAILNKKRFTLYELRDELSLLAMKGLVSEDSEEYVTLMVLINRSIASTKDFRITKFLHIQSKVVSDKKLRKHIENILSKVRDHKMPDEYQRIVSSYFDAARDLYRHKTWILVQLLTPLIAIASLLQNMIKTFGKLKQYLLSQKQRIDSIGTELERNSRQFASA